MHVRQNELHNAGVDQRKYHCFRKLQSDRLCGQNLHSSLQTFSSASKSWKNQMRAAALGSCPSLHDSFVSLPQPHRLEHKF